MSGSEQENDELQRKDTNLAFCCKKKKKLECLVRFKTRRAEYVSCERTGFSSFYSSSLWFANHMVQQREKKHTHYDDNHDDDCDDSSKKAGIRFL